MKIGLIGTNSGNSLYTIGKLLKSKGYDIIVIADAYGLSCWPIWSERKIELSFSHMFNQGFFKEENWKTLREFEKENSWENPSWFLRFQEMEYSLSDLVFAFRYIFGKYRKYIFRYLRTNFSGKALLKSYSRFGRTLKEMKSCDVVLCQGWSMMYPFLVKVPYVVAYYGSEIIDANKRKDYLDPLKNAFTILSSSALFEIYMDRVGLYKRTPYYIPLDTKTYKPLEIKKEEFKFQQKLKGKFIFFMPGRMSFIHKGIDKVLEAYSKIVKEYDNTLLILLNWGEDKEKTRKLINDLKIDDRILILDYYFSDVSLNLLFNLSHVMLDQLASGEFGFDTLAGLGRAAALAGKPIITSYYHEKNAYVNQDRPPVIHANTIEEIHESMKYCIDNQPILKEKGNELRDWVLSKYGDSALEDLIAILKKASKKNN